MARPAAVEMGDLNGDGKPDLARFVVAWCGVSGKKAVEAGVIHICGKHQGRTCL